MTDTQNISTDLDRARKSTGLLLSYQVRWVADQSPVKFIEKSRRVGISWAEAADDTLYASEKGKGEKRNVWYIGYTKDMALEFINDCANWARAYNMAVSAIDEYEEPDEDENGIVKEQKILAYKITFESGWRITALSSRPTNLRGKQGRVVIDEAAFHDDLPGLLKAAMAGVLTAKAREVALNPKLATYTVDVTDDAGELVAVFQGLVYRKKQTIEGTPATA